MTANADTSVRDRAWVEFVSHLRENGVEPARVHLPSITVRGYQELIVPTQISAITGRLKMRYREWPEGIDIVWLMAALSLSRK